jgi:uncharacterized protein (TIGR02099 family)
VTADVGLSDVRARLREDLPQLDLARLQGRLRWKTLPRLTEMSAEKLTFVTPDGLRLAPSDIRYTRSGGADEPTARTEISFTVLDLAAVSRLVDRLPVDDALRARLAEMQPKGRLRDFSIGWEGRWSRQGKYAVRGRFEEIGTSPSGYLPGFSSVTGQLELNESQGAIQLRAFTTTLNMPRVFVEPLPLDSFNARLNWTMVDGLPRVRLQTVEFASPHLAGTVSGTYDAAAEGPGSVDLSGIISRADGRQAWRYIPLVVRQHVRDWLQRSILAGSLRDTRLKLRGDLHTFPWSDGRSGLFQVVGTVEQAVVEYAAQWPRVELPRADLLFRGRRMEITAREARTQGTRLVAATVAVPDLGSSDPLLEIRGEAEGATADFLAFIESSPVDRMIDGFTHGMRATGRGYLQVAIDLPLHRVADAKLSGRYRLADNTLSARSMPRLEQLTGELTFDEKSVSISDATARVLGSPARFSVERDEAGGVRVRALGRVEAAVLRQQIGHPLANSLSGATDWRATVNLRGQRATVVVESDLVGLASSLPPPFGKPAQSALALRVERREAQPGVDSLAFALGGNSVSAQLLLDRAANRVTRAEVVFNGAASTPQRDGVWLSGRLDRLDLDRWHRALPAEELAAPGEPALPLAGVNVKLGELRVRSRTLGELDVEAVKRDRAWQWTLNGRDVAGTMTWAGGGARRLTARLSRLYLPAPTPDVGARDEGDTKPPQLPALDVVADDFRMNERQFGRLALSASLQGQDWRIEQVELRSPEGVLSGSGVWTGSGARPATTRMDVKAEVSDIGRYFARLKMPQGVKGGSGRLEGQLSWGGPPLALDLPSLSGVLSLDVKKGQFVKLEPGIGKLIGVFSLQALPRRVTLDFADVFSQGFAFDRISATANIAQGVARTTDFRMMGSSARVEMRGEVDLVAETQRLEVKVNPSVSESIALGAAIVNPAVGLATLLAQKALQDPINKMVAFEYQVSGTWSDPIVIKKKRPAPEPGPSSRR